MSVKDIPFGMMGIAFLMMVWLLHMVSDAKDEKIHELQTIIERGNCDKQPEHSLT